MRKKFLLSGLFLIFCFLQLMAQQRTVTGEVTDAATGKPLYGATVTISGSNVATTTNNDGNFTISLPKSNSLLVISNVGFDPQTITPSQSNVQIALNPTLSTLNEVVVTGYTTQRKKDITGSVSVVNAKELIANPGSNVESLLQGKASGVTVGTSGVPGAGASIRIRGFTTFNQNEPLYIVDGARVGSITDINPNDIESLQVLKDGSSAAAYGAAAANGVIIITTKKGKGKPKVSYDSYYGVQSLTRKYDLLNTEEYGKYLLLLQKGIPGQTATTFNLGQYNGGQTSTANPVIP